MAVCSGYIADGVLRGLFGFMPQLSINSSHPSDADVGSSPPALLEPLIARGFHGSLSHIRFRGSFYTIVSNENGLRAEKE